MRKLYRLHEYTESTSSTLGGQMQPRSRKQQEPLGLVWPRAQRRSIRVVAPNECIERIDDPQRDPSSGLVTVRGLGH